jgi:glycosyltransferase involved in cell wall biosynthesis
MVGPQAISSLDHVNVSDRLNVCVMYPNEYAYSETFIRNQIKHLPENVFPMYGAWFPFLLPGRKHILSRSPVLRAYRRMRRDLFGTSQQQMIAEALGRYLKKNQIHVVLTHYALTGIAVMDCCMAANVPLVVHFHGFDAFDYKTLAENEIAYKRLFGCARKVIAVSQHMRDQLCRLACPAEKIAVNPCGVDTQFFSGGGSIGFPPRFVAVARFAPVKGPQFTLKAFHMVLQKIPEATLVMIGDGELMEECKALTESLNIAHAVKFPGALPPDDVLKWLRQSKIFVQHGISNEQVSAEGMGLSVMEASSTGLPVVATRHGGLKESVVDGETGLLVDEGDIVGMAESMIRLANDDELCRKMGVQGRKRMKELFELSKRIDTLDKILHEAVGKQFAND